jgi:hypothetical protein
MRQTDSALFPGDDIGKGRPDAAFNGAPISLESVRGAGSISLFDAARRGRRDTN